MTKKGIVLIIFIAAIISILIIAVWGTLPENTNLPPIDYIIFTDYDDLNEDGEKRKEISNIVNETLPVYLLTYELGPEVNYSQLVVTLSNTKITHQVDLDNKQIIIYYSIEDIQQKNILTVTITDKRTQKSDTINLWFEIDDVIIIPD